MFAQRNCWTVAAGLIGLLATFTGASHGAPKYLPKTAIEAIEIPAVAKELELSEKQTIQFESLAIARKEAMMDLGEALRERPNNPAKVVQDHKVAIGELEREAMSFLLPVQRKRL